MSDHAFMLAVYKKDPSLEFPRLFKATSHPNTNRTCRARPKRREQCPPRRPSTSRLQDSEQGRGPGQPPRLASRPRWSTASCSPTRRLGPFSRPFISQPLSCSPLSRSTCQRLASNSQWACLSSFWFLSPFNDGLQDPRRH